MSSTEVGRWGETVAVQALMAHGYQIVERNYRCPAGEIDVVARDGDVYVFVEVKSRGSEEFGLPEDAITVDKGKRLLSAGQVYVTEHDLDVEWRVDVIAITFTSDGKVYRLSIHKDAVRADEP